MRFVGLRKLLDVARVRKATIGVRCGKTDVKWKLIHYSRNKRSKNGVLPLYKIRPE
jgi:hypothetical protein